MAKTIALLTYVALISIVSIASAFTVDLIHRDSPQSPSFDPSLSPPERLANALRRSFTRAQCFHSSSKLQSPASNIINAYGEYLMKYSVGSPPVPALGVADTGSDITWTQCQPCLNCFKQSSPVFDPKSSSTYRRIPCNSPSCRLVETSCSKSRNNCLYKETYGDGSFTQGELATDTFTLGPARVPNVTFGCGFKNDIVSGGGESGIVGLGGGSASLIRQLGGLADGKFSYCLVPLSSNSNSSKLNFGASAVVSGRGVTTTSLVKKSPDTFYYLTLDGISVGSQRLEIYSDPAADARRRREGNIIIDSGTTLTLLPERLYEKVEKALESSIRLKRVADPQGVLELCYLTRTEIRIPDVVVHFRGANVRLQQDNVFVRVSDDTVCLAFAPALDDAIYGNVAQTNFLVGYDLEKRTVSFKAYNCGN